MPSAERLSEKQLVEKAESRSFEGNYEILTQNFTVALEALLLSQLFVFRTIFQPWALTSDIPAAETGLFTKYICKIDRTRHGLWLVKTPCFIGVYNIEKRVLLFFATVSLYHKANEEA